MTPSGSGSSDDAPHEPLLSLPPGLREALKEPFGSVETDSHALLERAGSPIVAVGDVVTYHLREAGRPPDVAVIDGYTERTEVDDEIRRVVTETDGSDALEVTNPPATITEDLVCALLDGLAAPDPTTIVVDGEEDLAALPAIVAAPDGASVVYGQPGEGMVAVPVTTETRAEIRELLERMNGDVDRFWALLEDECRS